MDEVIDRIALAARDKFWNETQAGMNPNVGLIIRDALCEFCRTINYCPRGYGECESGCAYPGRCPKFGG